MPPTSGPVGTPKHRRPRPSLPRHPRTLTAKNRGPGPGTCTHGEGPTHTSSPASSLRARLPALLLWAPRRVTQRPVHSLPLATARHTQRCPLPGRPACHSLCTLPRSQCGSCPRITPCPLPSPVQGRPETRPLTSPAAALSSFQPQLLDKTQGAARRPAAPGRPPAPGTHRLHRRAAS